MKLKIFLTLVALYILSSVSAFSWGRHGHEAIAYIAEQNLSKKAKKNISHYLDGQSIVYYASWLDEVRNTPEYSYTAKWHSFAVDEDGEPCMGKNVSPKKYKGDAVLELTRLIDRLSHWKEMEDAEVADCIKIMVHLVGDMHCPVHVKYPGVKGYNVIDNGQEVSHHRLWDELIVEKIHKWGFMEYDYLLGGLSKSEARAIAAGTPIDWGRECAANCRVIYEWSKPGDEIATAYRVQARTLIDPQIQKAAYRLASLLNDIFGK